MHASGLEAADLPDNGGDAVPEKIETRDFSIDDGVNQIADVAEDYVVSKCMPLVADNEILSGILKAILDVLQRVFAAEPSTS